MRYEWECIYCGFTHIHSIRPTKCSCRHGYVRHFKKKCMDNCLDCGHIENNHFGVGCLEEKEIFDKDGIPVMVECGCKKFLFSELNETEKKE